MLSLYLDFFGRQDSEGWLAAFDIDIARSLLGAPGAKWHTGRKRQVTLLFFTCFDWLTALPFVCTRLVEVYAAPESLKPGAMNVWHENRAILFRPTGPENIAQQAQNGESLDQLMTRFAIPSNGRFSERLRYVFLLHGLKAAPLGRKTDVFPEIEKKKNERVSSDLLLGAAALRIMVQRVAKENRRKWPGEWPNWITRFGCDPRHGRASAESAKWWGWATDTEFYLAQQGVTGLTLRFFVEFLQKSLQGTARASQFDPRSRFLLALFDAGKILDARLVLSGNDLARLPREYHDPYTVARLSDSTTTSMVCLRCVDDIFIIEGTENFGLRMFHRDFPIGGFWNRSERKYHGKDLRISPRNCQVFLRHQGSWIGSFFLALRSKFHIEWNDVRVRQS